MSSAHLSQAASRILLCLQRFAQGNIVKRTIFELIAEEIMRNMPTPGASLHGGLSAHGSEQSYLGNQRWDLRLPWCSCMRPLSIPAFASGRSPELWRAHELCLLVLAVCQGELQ